ncbi:unnamed protein product [Polarella glacialis]|uniref:Uncharacterized protein n=1 Tax=Polarella glacialis TaxID=89957 RepID=A0A813KXT8_POLGL|nr:unnamed protein product [Polarella glacialis]CAE8718464.1 unnamed protein product [Polarella glacialis]
MAAAQPRLCVKQAMPPRTAVCWLSQQGLAFTKIDEMIKVLDDEEASDVEKKTQCETDLASDTQDKADIVTNIKSLTTDIDQLAKEISDKKVEIAETEKQSAELSNNRKAETAAYMEAKEADDQAFALLQQATMVITDWYGATHTSLLQVTARHKHSEPAGAPETSWGAGEQYDGAKQSGNAISAVMKEGGSGSGQGHGLCEALRK